MAMKYYPTDYFVFLITVAITVYVFKTHGLWGFVALFLAVPIFNGYRLLSGHRRLQ